MLLIFSVLKILKFRLESKCKNSNLVKVKINHGL